MVVKNHVIIQFPGTILYYHVIYVIVKCQHIHHQNVVLHYDRFPKLLCTVHCTIMKKLQEKSELNTQSSYIFNLVWELLL
jgi:hypothetical protein